MKKMIKSGIAALAVVASAMTFAQDAAEAANESVSDGEGVVGWTPVALSLASPVQFPYGCARWDVFGLALGIFYNDAPILKGVDISLANRVREEFTGISFGGIFNWSGSDAYGVRATLGGNFASGTTYGWDIGGFGYRKDFYGLDTELVCGVQDSLHGAQVSLLGSYTKKDCWGLTAGCFNFANQMHGVQLGFLYNQTEVLKGMQVALVNYARECPSGCQIGIVNIILDNQIKVLPIFNCYFGSVER